MLARDKHDSLWRKYERKKFYETDFRITRTYRRRRDSTTNDRFVVDVVGGATSIGRKVILPTDVWSIMEEGVLVHLMTVVEITGSYQRRPNILSTKCLLAKCLLAKCQLAKCLLASCFLCWSNVCWPIVCWPSVCWPSVCWPSVCWPSIYWPYVGWPIICSVGQLSVLLAKCLLAKSLLAKCLLAKCLLA